MGFLIVKENLISLQTCISRCLSLSLRKKAHMEKADVFTVPKLSFHLQFSHRRNPVPLFIFCVEREKYSLPLYTVSPINILL